MAGGRVESVSAAAGHSFSKPVRPDIELVAGLGVRGDAHAGVTVKHRSRVRVDPTQPNLRQVHLIPGELLDELAVISARIGPGALGENITTRGIDLIALPRDTVLKIGTARVRVTGLRNPCKQIEDFGAGLLEAVLERRADGTLVRKAGVMGVVLEGGAVRPGDAIEIELPPLPHVALEKV
jgi:MOSC domain-containing protein YiiM